MGVSIEDICIRFRRLLLDASGGTDMREVGYEAGCGEVEWGHRTHWGCVSVGGMELVREVYSENMEWGEDVDVIRGVLEARCVYSITDMGLMEILRVVERLRREGETKR